MWPVGATATSVWDAWPISVYGTTSLMCVSLQGNQILHPLILPMFQYYIPTNTLNMTLPLLHCHNQLSVAIMENIWPNITSLPYINKMAVAVREESQLDDTSKSQKPTMYEHEQGMLTAASSHHCILKY